VQQDSLDVVYDQPNSIASMNSLGFPEANILPGELSGTTFTSVLGSTEVQIDSAASKVVAGIRPEGLFIGSGSGSIDAKVGLLENLGSEFAVYFNIKDSDLVTVISRTDNESLAKLKSKNVSISYKPDALVLFDAQSGKRVGQGVSHV
jgi:ABC-type sugar transport system ATPase subunit